MTEELEACFLIDELEEPLYSNWPIRWLFDPSEFTKEDIAALTAPVWPGKLIKLSNPLRRYKTMFVDSLVPLCPLNGQR